MPKILIANWKMNKDLKDAASFIKAFKKDIKKIKNSAAVICPPFTLLHEMKKMLRGSSIKLGAQNIYFEEKGAFTGEISASMVKDAGCEYVILGHSERRQYFNESDELISKKVKSALKNSLKVILCIGETLEQRNNNSTFNVLQNQLERCLKDVSEKEIENISIAYEPVWAIGTGKNATSEQAEEAHKFIRSLLSKICNKNAAANAIIIYGGSVNENNIADFMRIKDVNGVLVGGASLNPETFAKICSVRVL
ncbi:triose-phosphate isomerase [Candidatus Woesearchaeota archaeon]|nr:triose-phosphate isomerase [Candidatus Woesearchaeota archaeon]